MEEEATERAQRIFAALDVNGDGGLEEEEFIQVRSLRGQNSAGELFSGLPEGRGPNDPPERLK